MGKYFFDEDNVAFYNDSIHSNIPDKAKHITSDQYNEIKSLLSDGCKVHVGDNGDISWSEPDYRKDVPYFVTRAQGKAALIRAGLWNGVIDFVNSISDPVEKAVAEVALNDTTNWQRSSPFLNSAAEALGLTDEQLNQLFIDASKIEL